MNTTDRMKKTFWREQITKMMNYKNPRIGDKWSDLRNTLLTPNERTDIETRVGIITSIINARHEEHLTQKDIEAKSGVRQISLKFRW